MIVKETVSFLVAVTAQGNVSRFAKQNDVSRQTVHSWLNCDGELDILNCDSRTKLKTLWKTYGREAS